MFISTRGCPKHEGLRQIRDALMKLPRKHLILADSAQLIASKNQKSQLLYPILFFILNLLVCAAFERHLRVDPTTLTLGYFFVAEFVLYCASLLAQYQRLTYQVLEKSTIFPVSSFSALVFCVSSDLRRPVSIVFLLTNALLLGIVYHSSIALFTTTVVIFILLFISIELVFVAWALLIRRNPNPELVLVLSFLALLLTTFVAAEFYGGGPIVSSLPITSWAAQGIVAARVGSTNGVLMSTLLLLGTAAISAFVASTLYRRM